MCGGCGERWAIKAARPQYEAIMSLNRQTMIRSTNVQLPKRVAFNSMLPAWAGLCVGQFFLLFFAGKAEDIGGITFSRLFDPPHASKPPGILTRFTSLPSHLLKVILLRHGAKILNVLSVGKKVIEKIAGNEIWIMSVLLNDFKAFRLVIKFWKI